MTSPGARAARLLRWYPRSWRSRYSEEFTELLMADIEERPRSRSRTADVIRGGLVARLGAAGLGGAAPEPGTERARASASLASLGCCAAVFAGVGGAMWSQLTTGWQWSAPGRAGVTVAMFAMSAAMGALAVLALLAVLPVAWRVVAARPPGLRGPSLLFLAGLAVMVAGGLALRQRLAGHRRPLVGPPGPGPGRGGGLLLGVNAVRLLVLGSSRRAGRVPRGRGRLDGAQPAGRGGRGSRRGHRGPRAGQSPDVLSPAVLRFETWLGRAACAAMAVFVAGACAWVTARAPGPFRPGAIDAAGLAVLTLALGVARQAAGQAGVGAR